MSNIIRSNDFICGSLATLQFNGDPKSKITIDLQCKGIPSDIVMDDIMGRLFRKSKQGSVLLYNKERTKYIVLRELPDDRVSVKYADGPFISVVSINHNQLKMMMQGIVKGNMEANDSK